MPITRHSAAQCFARIATPVVILASVGCTSQRHHDFYAVRSVSVAPTEGDGTVIVRSPKPDLLTRERLALAIADASRSN